MSRKKEQPLSLREKIKAYHRSLTGEACAKFVEVFCAETESCNFKEALTGKNLQPVFTLAKKAIVGLPGSEPPEEDDDED